MPPGCWVAEFRGLGGLVLEQDPKNYVCGGWCTVTRGHGKGSAVFLREFGKAPQREGAYELSFEGEYDITRLGRKEGREGGEEGRKEDSQGDGSTEVG